MPGSAVLTPHQPDIQQFVSWLFRYADEGSYISLRAFDQFERGKQALFITPVQLKGRLGDIVTQAVFAAERAANAPSPAVFAPPVATFNNPSTARSIDVANGVALSVDVDVGDTSAARRRLEHSLGPCTIAMQSGGDWSDPETGEIHAKQHLHWRLSEPTRTAEDHAKLQYARAMALKLVGGDATAAPPAHPLRWPGSWNTKAKPRLARITGGNEAAEVHLDYAIERLEEAIEAAGLDVDNTPRVSGIPTANMQHVALALAHMKNEGLGWEEWNRIGMATWRASGGSSEGMDAWCEWSAKSNKHEDQACVDRWAHYAGSPPSRIGAGTIFFQAQSEGWRRPEPEQAEPPPDIDDAGYMAAVERDLAMSANQWRDLEARESGHAAPASEGARVAAGKNLLRILEAGWGEEEIPLRPWIAPGYFMRRSVTVLSGQGSAGKSSIVIAWTCCMAIGAAFDRLRVKEPIRIGVYNVEDDQDEQRRRFSAMAQRLGITTHQVMQNVAILSPERIGTLVQITPEGRMLASTPVMEALRAWIDLRRPGVLFLDPFVELHGQEENDNTAIRAVMAFLRALAMEFDMAVVVLHHSRKGEATPGDPDSLRGASAIVGAARVVLTLNVMTEAEAEKLNISSDRRRDYFRLDDAKKNHARLEEVSWFERQERRLNNGIEDTPGDGVVVAWPWKPPSVWKEMTPDLIGAVLDKLSTGPSPGILYASSKRGASNARWAGQVLMDIMDHTEAQAKQVIGAWLKSGVLTETTYRDSNEGKDRTGVLVDRSKLP